MEKQLFSWSEWEQADAMAFTFSDVVLKVLIGPYPAGTRFPSVLVDYDSGVLVMHDVAGAEVAEFPLKLAIG